MVKSYIRNAKEEEPVTIQRPVALTSREIEILRLFVAGYINKEISDQLDISIRTVETHKNHIMKKLELKSTVELIKFAIRNKFAEL
jgi:two-component system response regulator NreC